MFDAIIAFIRSLYRTDQPIPLHAPCLGPAERDAVAAAVDSGFVSSVGADVSAFERDVAEYVGAPHAVATVNGTAALQVALRLADVRPGDAVITQAFSFVATANAIAYLGAEPIFLDIEADTLGLSPEALRRFLQDKTDRTADGPVSRATGRPIRACVPMHSFGHAARIDAIAEICHDHGLALIEDAAEALGSRLDDGRHLGTIGRIGAFSFNGNKILTTGGGGMIVTEDADLAARARHLTTTAKQPHPWAFVHDEIGYNYRMPNLNAALGRAQMTRLPAFLADKRAIAQAYCGFFDARPEQFVSPPSFSRSNHWLNAVVFANQDQRDGFLAQANAAGIMSRPAWTLLCDLAPYRHAECAPLSVARDMGERLVNLPSSARLA
ncbi:MAG: LegC family aminotransferase [Rhodothalassiaceae bacterium]